MQADEWPLKQAIHGILINFYPEFEIKNLFLKMLPMQVGILKTNKTKL